MVFQREFHLTIRYWFVLSLPFCATKIGTSILGVPTWLRTPPYHSLLGAVMALAQFLDFVELHLFHDGFIGLWVTYHLTIFIVSIVFTLLRWHGYHSVVFNGFCKPFLSTHFAFLFINVLLTLFLFHDAKVLNFFETTKFFSGNFQFLTFVKQTINWRNLFLLTEVRHHVRNSKEHSLNDGKRDNLSYCKHTLLISFVMQRYEIYLN